MAVKKAIETDADIVMASDPDADRLGVAVKNDKGEWILQTETKRLWYLSTTLSVAGKNP